MTDSARAFLVGRNPEADSKLPYLLLLPLEDGLVLKAREAWPATARVYCHRFQGGWPTDAEIIEQTPVRLCRRRGAAIDLLLDRPRLARSQFVFTQVKGREAIFWQTQKTARSANPGGRIPRRQTLAGAVTIVVDTRERYPYRFAPQGADSIRATVPAGDYAVYAPDGTGLAAVERKSLDNLAATLSDGTLAFQLQPLAELPFAAAVVVVVEARYSAASPKNGPTASSPQHSPHVRPKPDRLRHHGVVDRIFDPYRRERRLANGARWSGPLRSRTAPPTPPRP